MKIRVSRKYHGPGTRPVDRHLRQLVKWLLIALVLSVATPAVLSIAFAKQPPVSTCDALLAKYKATPAHITLKCTRP